jgi:amino acid transporter
MDERAEIWIARDPDTNAESLPVSLRKLRKGVRIGRLNTAMLVTRVGSTAWVTLERLLADATAMTPTPPPPTAQTQAPASTPPPPLTPTPSPTPPLTPSPSLTSTPAPTTERTLSVADASGEHDALLTTQWFNEPAPEPDDDEPIFVSQSVLDLGFERVMTTKLVRLTWVLLIATLAITVLASFLRVAAALASGNSQQIATSIATVPVVVLACAVLGAFGRMLLEVLLAIFRISDRMSRITAR